VESLKTDILDVKLLAKVTTSARGSKYKSPIPLAKQRDSEFGRAIAVPSSYTQVYV